jgi:hypothetical protein
MGLILYFRGEHPGEGKNGPTRRAESKVYRFLAADLAGSLHEVFKVFCDVL